MGTVSKVQYWKQVTKYLSRVLLAVSIFINTVLGGSTNQSFSARNWHWKKLGYWNIVWIIDIIFFLEKDHCQESYIKWCIINNAIQHYDEIGEKRFILKGNISYSRSEYL
jgi:hypothetical protein